MTKESLIKFEGEINVFDLKKRMLDECDITDELTDTTISIKLIDGQGNILMLIEASAKDFSENEATKCEYGCFIERFEFDERIINTHIWCDVIRSFVTSVRYSLFKCNNSNYLCRYKYIWAQKNINEQCLIANILGLDNILRINDITIYKGYIN